MGSTSYINGDGYARYTGGGTLFINGESIAIVEFEAELNHKEMQTATTAGIIKDVSQQIDFKGKFTDIAGTHKFWSMFMGIDAMESTAESLYSGAGTGADQTATADAQPTLPSILQISLSKSGTTVPTITPDAIVIAGKDAFGNTITENFNYTCLETIVGSLLFSQIDSIAIPGTLSSDTKVTVSTVAGVKSGKPTIVPKFNLQGFIKGSDGHLQGVQMKNVTILNKPKFKLEGKEEHIKEEIEFVLSNANEDIIFYEYIPQ
ncbi:hypothetical protein [Methanothermococcus okinawensis]|uniref:Uncharacterized protein n=1 Tax=Methanothermococcus okinawensis (strain DSM 14208 / JCM 11175 / IH1) TaxID=647113 RepID=F8AKA3_METOI|nr:hypothetical protein [Methanothermococcus okinawensis]AEH06303.1 hypothetical protein Metok_0313 [Methanothermococcus okinawensis IH1]